MAERRSRRRPVRIEVETEKVDGAIELSEIVRRMQGHAATEAPRARRGPRTSGKTEERTRTVERLAAELASELEALGAEWRPGPPPPRARRGRGGGRAFAHAHAARRG